FPTHLPPPRSPVLLPFLPIRHLSNQKVPSLILISPHLIPKILHLPLLSFRRSTSPIVPLGSRRISTCRSHFRRRCRHCISRRSCPLSPPRCYGVVYPSCLAAVARGARGDVRHAP